LIATARFRLVSVALYTSPYSCAAHADLGEDFVGTEASTGGKDQTMWIIRAGPKSEADHSWKTPQGRSGPSEREKETAGSVRAATA
jgi:hypothetical protein